MLHVPRRYFAGTELSDLSVLQPGEEAAVLARVLRTDVHQLQGGHSRRGGTSSRLSAVISDGHGSMELAFFGKPVVIDYWRRQLQVGARGIFAGKVSEFRGTRQLTHPDFVIIGDDGEFLGGAKRNAVLAEVTRAPLIGIYPATSKLRTWTIAQSIGIALDELTGLPDPLPAAVRQQAGVIAYEEALRAVHQPQTPEEIPGGRDRLRFDEAFALQLDHGPPPRRLEGTWRRPPSGRRRRAAHRVRREAAVHADRRAGRGQRADHGRAGSTPTDAAAAAGRGRIGQDDRGAAGHARGGRRRWPGRAAGADRGAGRPALPDGAPHSSAISPAAVSSPAEGPPPTSSS